MKNNAFSLIELIVVIAIVGLLSAIAVPVYTSYSERAKISSARNVIDGQVQKVANFYAANGTFPDVNSQIGLPIFLGPPNTVDDYFAPYLAYAAVNDHPQYVTGQCNFTFIAGIISDYSGGAFTISNTTAPMINYLNFIIDANNTIVTKCVAFESNNGIPTGRTGLAPGCLEGGNDMNDLMQPILDYVATACD